MGEVEGHVTEGRCIQPQGDVHDPLTFAATTVLLTMAAAIACWIPVRKAARVDPFVALRYE